MCKNKGETFYYIRLIGRMSRWPDGENTVYSGPKKILADAVTLDLKTNDNELSWWRVSNLDDDTVELAAASLVSPFKDAPSKKLYLAVVPERLLVRRLQMQHTPENANTAIISMRECHYDSVDMNLGDIGLVASIVAKGTSEKSKTIQIRTVQRSRLIERLKEEYRVGNIDLEKLGGWGKSKLGCG